MFEVNFLGATNRGNCLPLLLTGLFSYWECTATRAMGLRPRHRSVNCRDIELKRKHLLQCKSSQVWLDDCREIEIENDKEILEAYSVRKPVGYKPKLSSRWFYLSCLEMFHGENAKGCMDCLDKKGGKLWWQLMMWKSLNASEPVSFKPWNQVILEVWGLFALSLSSIQTHFCLVAFFSNIGQNLMWQQVSHLGSQALLFRM